MEATTSAAAANSGRITRIARRRAQPGKEAQYEALIRELFEAMHKTPGFLAAEMVPPEQAGGFYQVIVHFRSEADLQVWDACPARARLHQRIREVADAEPDYRSL